MSTRFLDGNSGHICISIGDLPSLKLRCMLQPRGWAKQLIASLPFCLCSLYTVKKGYSFSSPQPGIRDVTKLSIAGNKLVIPSQSK
jgi:hypothetical protein